VRHQTQVRAQLLALLPEVNQRFMLPRIRLLTMQSLQNVNATKFMGADFPLFRKPLKYFDAGRVESKTNHRRYTFWWHNF
jgi:hypothetical protein